MPGELPHGRKRPVRRRCHPEQGTACARAGRVTGTAATAAPPVACAGQAATAISQAAVMGRDHTAATPIRRGGVPRHQPYQNAAAATTVTGASSTATATRAALRTSRSSPRPAARRTGLRGYAYEARWRLTAATRSR